MTFFFIECATINDDAVVSVITHYVTILLQWVYLESLDV
jgi:hypothetical protein